MSQTLDLAFFRGKLMEERDRILGHSPESGDTESSPGANPDRSELAQSYSNRERDLALHEMERAQLKRIEASLQRLDEGTYGNCTRCGEAITPERLEIIPYTELCIRCQRELEHDKGVI